MLEGKTALVTGAGRGIGRQIALTLAAEGADVIVNCNASCEQAEKTAEEIRKLGRRAEVLQASVADFQACGDMVKKALELFGHIDILVNNAGITRDNLVIGMKEEDFDAVIDTNLKGTFNTIRHLYRNFMKQKSGRIINLSSVSGVLGNAGQANYAASKAGVIGLTKSIAKELASRNVTVNAVAPASILGANVRPMDPKVAQRREPVDFATPVTREGEPQDVANLVLFLASPEASFITGQIIAVDGGLSVQARPVTMAPLEITPQNIHEVYFKDKKEIKVGINNE